MKKNLVLFVLFVLPIVAYLFFASGVNSFAKLPTITPTIPDLQEWKTTEGKSVTLNNKITILGFIGYDVEHHKGGFFNLYEKIYARNKEFKDFQMSYYSKLQLQGSLNEKLGTPNVYIVDKKRNLRGRKGKNKKGEEEYQEGYNTFKVSDLYNNMIDDVKVILAEYRLALKKNNKANRKI